MRASAEEENHNEKGLDEVLRALGLPQYGKAFPETEDLEWFLKLRTLYVVRLALVLRDVVFLGEDDDSKHKFAR